MATDPSARATLKHIADELGVSISTVSRVLNGQARKYRISSDTETAVIACAKARHFEPNLLARGLRLNRTMTIGLIIPDIANPFFATIAHEVAVEVHRRGYALLLCDSQELESLEMRSLEALCSRKVDGVIVCPVGIAAEHLKPFEEGGLPMVVADRHFPNLNIPQVVSDNFGGARMATEFLLEQGHTRIVCVEGLQGTAPNVERLRGFQAALKAAGLDHTSKVTGATFRESSGYNQTRRLLETQGDFTAILAFSSPLGLGALRALKEAGRRVPEDVSIISFDDPPYQALLSPPMTTVAQACDELGRQTVQRLFERIEHSQPSTGEVVSLPTRLVIRGSVASL